MIGRIIGKHRVIAKIADGVTGAVYKAEHTVIGRHVAIKVLRSEYSADPELVARFFEVLRAVSSVEHPSIVQIFDFGYHEMAAFIVMEYLDFETLEQRIRRDGRMRMAFALDLVSQVTDALAAVHERGIIHEDLKADNIALIPDPAVPGGQRAKLLDFGLSTLLTDSGTGARQVRNEAELPTYTAPEQLLGPDDVDQRADLYALGVIFFEMLCGRPPFTSRDLLELVQQVLGGEAPTPRSLIASIPAEVESVIVRLMRKDPRERYPDARELSAAVEDLRGDFMNDISSIGVRPSLGKIRFSTNPPVEPDREPVGLVVTEAGASDQGPAGHGAGHGPVASAISPSRAVLILAIAVAVIAGLVAVALV